jgi:hypothetical protein
MWLRETALTSNILRYLPTALAAYAHRAEERLLEGQTPNNEKSLRLLGRTRRLTFSKKGSAGFNITVTTYDNGFLVYLTVSLLCHVARWPYVILLCCCILFRFCFRFSIFLLILTGFIFIASMSAFFIQISQRYSFLTLPPFHIKSYFHGIWQPSSFCFTSDPFVTHDFAFILFLLPSLS